MRLRHAGWAALLAGAMAIAAFAPAPGHAAQTVVTLGTGGVVGVYYPLGRTLCRFVTAGRRQHSVRCTAAATTGSVFNIDAVLAGDMELGIAQSDIQYYAMKGMGPYAGKPKPKLRALFSVYPELFTVVARRDAGIHGFADLKGKRVNIGDAGSGTRATMELVMQAFGIARSDFKLATEFKFIEMAPALCDNKIDAFVLVAGHPNPIFAEAATECDITIVPVAGPQIDHLIATHPFYAKANVPGGVYAGVEEARPTFGPLATIVVSADMTDATAYVITKAVFDNFDDFKRLHPTLSGLTREGALVGNTVPIHPGALRYFKEQGLVQ